MSRGSKLDTRLRGNESAWEFVGVPQWKQDAEGVIYPPAWPAAQIAVVGAYSYDLAREDYGLVISGVLADGSHIEVGLDGRLICSQVGSATHGSYIAPERLDTHPGCYRSILVTHGVSESADASWDSSNC